MWGAALTTGAMTAGALRLTGETCARAEGASAMRTGALGGAATTTGAGAGAGETCTGASSTRTSGSGAGRAAAGDGTKAATIADGAFGSLGGSVASKAHPATTPTVRAVKPR